MITTINKETILVVAEHFQGDVRPATYELVQAAETIQQIRPGPIQILILGQDVEALANLLAETTGKDVLGISAPQLSHYNGQVFTEALVDLLSGAPPAYVCVAHSSRGSDFAPGLAARLKGTCITAVNAIFACEEGICFSRDLFGGKVTAEMVSSASTTVLTIAPGSYPPSSGSHLKRRGRGGVQHKKISVKEKKSKTLSIKLFQTSDVDLSDALVIVSAGRGIGDAQNLERIYALAALIPQSVVCGSRPVIDLGWMPYDRQVGVTGATVSPALYLACGISGAAQHISGMKGSGFIVAINSDPTAAIFNQSDICIVEDLDVFIPALIDAITTRR